MSEVWVVETFVDGHGSLDYLFVEGVWSSLEGAVGHLERDRGARCDDPGYEDVEDTSWMRDGPDGSVYVWFVSRWEVRDG